MFAACHLLVEEYLAQGMAVLFDAANLTDRFRTPLYRIAESLTVPLAVVEVTAPRETVRRRLAEPGGGVGPEHQLRRRLAGLLPYGAPLGADKPRNVSWLTPR